MTILETERLTVRRLTLNDSSFILDLLNTPGWLAHIGDRDVHTLEQADTYLQNGPLASYAVNRFGLWAVQRKGTETPIGLCGLIRRDTLDHPDLGYAFLPRYMGQGYAREAAEAVLAFARDTLHLPTILAITTPTNTRSINVLEKTGFIFVETTIPANGGESLRLFSYSSTTYV